MINEKNYYHLTFVEYIENLINLFSIYRMKKKINKRKEIKIDFLYHHIKIIQKY
jgi:hypothetical protein